ncbi:dihydroxy-acid dehydratase domain-containing protein [Staphylococcus aureus]
MQPKVEINAHWFDGVFYIPNCDNITPGMILAAMRNKRTSYLLLWWTNESWLICTWKSINTFINVSKQSAHLKKDRFLKKNF